MTTVLFHEDFDGNGPGFQGPSFEAWSIGGDPILAGRWQLSYPEDNNHSGGSDRYATVHSSSFEFNDTLVWMISPLIYVGYYEDVTLSAKLYFKSQESITVGEDTLTISILSIDYNSASADSVRQDTIDVIGQDMSSDDPAVQGPMSWDLTSFTNKCNLIQLAFSWYSTAGGYPHIQLDDISVTGEAIVSPPSNFKAQIS